MLRAGIAVVSVVAAVLLYMVIQSNDIKKSQQEVIEEKVVQLAETRIKLDSIMHQLDSKIAEIQELGGDISELQKPKLSWSWIRLNYSKILLKKLRVLRLRIRLKF
jgi:hypothetical protein